MDDNVLYIASTLLAVCGLVLLFLAKPPGSEQQYVLEGKVIAVHGREAVVEAHVTLVGKNLRTGEAVDTPVFWNGEAFVMVQR